MGAVEDALHSDLSRSLPLFYISVYNLFELSFVNLW